jgi:phosphoribosylanthranilate isomerase
VAAVRVKICGITRLADALAAVQLGADALGFNFWPGSKRYCPPAKAERIISALPPFVTTVGVFVNHTRREIERVAERTGIQVVQLHGDEPTGLISELPLPVIRAVHMAGRHSLPALRVTGPWAFLLDAPTQGFGGSGRTFDWRLLRGAKARVPLILAGGLTPENVRAAVRKLRPSAVDVASGVESAPGKKDVRKMKRFIREAKEA